MKHCLAVLWRRFPGIYVSGWPWDQFFVVIGLIWKTSGVERCTHSKILMQYCTSHMWGQLLQWHCGFSNLLPFTPDVMYIQCVIWTKILTRQQDRLLIKVTCPVLWGQWTLSWRPITIAINLTCPPDRLLKCSQSSPKWASDWPGGQATFDTLHV